MCRLYANSTPYDVKELVFEDPSIYEGHGSNCPHFQGELCKLAFCQRLKPLPRHPGCYFTLRESLVFPS